MMQTLKRGIMQCYAGESKRGGTPDVIAIGSEGRGVDVEMRGWCSELSQVQVISR